MIENTTENKAKLAGLYYGQKVIRETKYELSPLCKVFPIFLEEIEKWHLELKPLSSITREDLIAIGFNFPDDVSEITIEISPDSYIKHWTGIEQSRLIKEGYLTLKDFDYLRSKGYALPWMGLSVEKQVEYGWIKLEQ